MNKNIYLEKINSLSESDVDVWRVNGKYIRESFDPDFTNFGQHYVYPNFIPKNEFWLDKEKMGGEEKYFIVNLTVEYELMSKGADYKIAHEEAKRAEAAQRERDLSLKKVKNIPKEKLLKKIRKNKLITGRDYPEVWIVDGELVRGLFYIDFTIGGHDKVYDFVPKNEIWIDDDVYSDELDYVLIHELHERRLMAGGMDYAKAHESANKQEFFCRKKPIVFRKKIAEEIMLA